MIVNQPLGVAVLSVLFSAVFVFAPVATDATVAPSPVPAVSQPLEDEPGWDCATMGNRVCGPMFESGTGAFIGGYNYCRAR